MKESEQTVSRSLKRDGPTPPTRVLGRPASPALPDFHAVLGATLLATGVLLTMASLLVSRVLFGAVAAFWLKTQAAKDSVFGSGGLGDRKYACG